MKDETIVTIVIAIVIMTPIIRDILYPHSPSKYMEFFFGDKKQDKENKNVRLSKIHSSSTR